MYHLLEQHKEFKLDHLPTNGNLVNFSLFRDLSEAIVFRSFSIKYVIEGREKYLVNGNKYTVNTGQYLLANPFCTGRVEIDSATPVKGICIDLSSDILSDVLSQIVDPADSFSKYPLKSFFHSEEFLENQYSSENTNLGKLLLQLGKILQRNPYAEYRFEKEFYYNLAERIVQDQESIVNQLYSISAKKHPTRKDLYRKVAHAKAYIDEKFSEKLSIPHIASEVLMSEYHFFRIFRMVYQISPQQYLIKKRLAKASHLLREQKYSITEIAYKSGFADLYSFSATYKKHFGQSPSSIQEQ